VEVGAHEFRNHFGWYMQRAAAGEEILVTRRGRAYARLCPPHAQLTPPPAAIPSPPIHGSNGGRTDPSPSLTTHPFSNGYNRRH
jgi:prevent-host-death family protein